MNRNKSKSKKKPARIDERLVPSVESGIQDRKNKSNKDVVVKNKLMDDKFSEYYRSYKSITALPHTFSEDIVKKKTASLKPGKKSLIWKGVLSTDDLYCVKCIESMASDSTFIWFLNFLLYKDSLSKYSFLKPCLVSTTAGNFSIEKSNIINMETKRYCFDFIVDVKQ